MRFVTNAGRVMALFFIVVLSACKGGGGSGNEQSSTSISLNNITFSVASPDAPTPASQTITATGSPGTVYLVILSNGRAIVNTTYKVVGTTAQILVNFPSPSSLGAGVFTGTLTATGYTCADPACTRPVAGNTQIVNVTYTIPPIVRFVAPYVGVDGVAGSVVIRGQGFQQFLVQNVLFGSTVGTFTVVSDTEIQASYPALAASSSPYAVQLQMPSNAGTITSLANLVVVKPPACGGPTIAYPPSTTPTVNELVYDAERQALLVADSFDGKILRYSCSGSSWTTATINPLSDIALSTNGKQLLALAPMALNQLDPVTLIATAPATPAPSFATAGTAFNNLAVGNDGNAVVTTSLPPSTNTELYIYCNPVYVTCTSALTQAASPSTLDNSTAVASADGSLIDLIQKDPTLVSPPSVYQYVAASDTFSGTSVVLNQNSVNPVTPALVVSFTPPNTTTSTTRIVLSGKDATGATVTNVYDGSYNLLGALTLPGTPFAVVIKPDITRAYTFDSSGQVLSFDLTAAPIGGAFSPTAARTPANPGTGVRMAISPDGGTLFLAGNSQIVIIPSF